MKLRGKGCLVALVLLPLAKAWSVEQELEPGIVPLGPFDLAPLLNIKESYSDNIYHSDISKKASLITQINAGGELSLSRKLNRYALDYSFLSSQYHSSPADNYVDQYFGARAHHEINSRNRFDFKSAYILGHYMRGTYYSQGNIATQLNEPDQFHQYNAGLNYRYGRVDARGNLGLGLDWSRQVFDNDRERTQQFDNSRYKVTPGFYFRLMPKTYLTTEIENFLVDYENEEENASASNGTSDIDTQFSGRSYFKQRYLVGLAWEHSAITKGVFRAGYLQQEFTHADTGTLDGFTLDGKLTWSPLAYSRFDFELSRDVQPSLGTGLSRQVQIYSAGWTHDWPHRISTRIDGSYQDVTTEGINTKSSGASFGFNLKYAMRSWLDLGFNYSYSNLQAVSNDLTATQNIFFLYLNFNPEVSTVY